MFSSICSNVKGLYLHELLKQKFEFEQGSFDFCTSSLPSWLLSICHIGILWCSACPQSCQSRQSPGWEMVRAQTDISRIVWTVTASLLLSPSPTYTQAAAAASVQGNAAGGAEELLPICTQLIRHCAFDDWPFPGCSLCVCAGVTQHF